MADREVPAGLADLERDGFVLVRGALDADTVATWKHKLYDLHRRGLNEIDNSVGNVAFESLLRLEPELSRGLIGVVAGPGRPPQRRALPQGFPRQAVPAPLAARAHQPARLPPGVAHGLRRLPLPGAQRRGGPPAARAVHEHHFLPDRQHPGTGPADVPEGLRGPLAAGGAAAARPLHRRSANPFQAWCDAQSQEHLYPLAGDAIVFFAHVPHQGVKFGDDPEDDIRANLVLHFQQNPMYPGIKFVSSPDFTLQTLGYAGTFPFADS